MSSTKKNKDIQYKKIIIEYNEKENARYSFKAYYKYPFLKSYISKAKFRDILDHANIIIYDSKMKKAKYDKLEINKCINILFIIAIFFIFIYTNLLYFMLAEEKIQIHIMTGGVFCFFISAIILFIIEGYNSLRKVEGNKTLYEFFKYDMINYIEKLNNKYKEDMNFKFDQNNKNIICFVRLYQKDTNNNNKLGDTIPKSHEI